MIKPKLLYISINDGSDTRINKEIKTLASAFDIYYIGIGKSKEKAFAQSHCKSFITVTGYHKAISSLVRFYLLFIRTYFSHSFHSIHVINEQLLLIFLPFLYWSKRKLVLDIFDSIFLRMKRNVEIFKKMVYKVPKTILVTDDNRKLLMPKRFHYKIIVIENYPYRYSNQTFKLSRGEELIIFYNGSMSKARGTEMLLGMLKIDETVKIKMAGWVYDEETKILSQHSQVDFLGVITQQESMHTAAQCDYILSLYEPINENNINASPNKIYDAIQAKTPVIINAEVKIANFVKEKQIGYVIHSFYEKDYSRMIQDLKALKSIFKFDTTLQSTYTWEAIQDKLLQAHQQ